MKYILDSDMITYLYDSGFAQHQLFLQRFLQLQSDDIVQISFFELEYSLYNVPRKDQQLEIRQLK